MDKVISGIDSIEMSAIRTGRASVAIFDNPASGLLRHADAFNQVANLHVPEPSR